MILSSYCGQAGQNQKIATIIAVNAISLEISDPLARFVNEAKGKRLVMLGEASHGTNEYYAWRDSISRALIRTGNFRFIAVEGDFAALFELNRYVKDLPGNAGSARKVLGSLNRWPEWMWGNEETIALAEWLRSYNDSVGDPDRKIGFYGMDVYDEWRSMDQVLTFLQQKNTGLYQEVNTLYKCFAPFSRDSWKYAQSIQQGHKSCEEETAKVVQLLYESEYLRNNSTDLEYFALIQNARVKKNAEKFFRKSATRRDASAWNARVHHMHQTINDLMGLYGEISSGIVWAHNTHIGDARFTDMATTGNVNIGQLSRIEYGEQNVFLVGFTTYRGRVMAGSSWGARGREMRLASARWGSLEHTLNKTDLQDFYVVFDEKLRSKEILLNPVGHRAVGVVFSPANEPRQYVPTIFPLRYDALFFFQNTKALRPLR